MKRLLSLLIFSLFAFSVNAQSFDRGNYSMVSEISPGIYMVGVGGHPEKGDFRKMKVGIVEASGEVLLTPEYNEIGDFYNGYAYVRKNDEYGVIDEKFNLIFPCEFTSLGSFNEYGLTWVNVGGDADGLKGAIKGGKYGVIRGDGRVIIPPRYRAIATFDVMPSVESDFSRNPMFKDQSDYRKYISNYGAHSYQYLAPSFGDILDMEQSQYIVYSSKADKSGDGLVYMDGTIAVEEGICDVIFAPSCDMIPVRRRNTSEGIFLNYYSIQSQSFLFPKWYNVDCVTPFVDDYAVLTEKGKHRIIDINGAQVSSGAYVAILPSNSGAFVTGTPRGFGLIDIQGNDLVSGSMSQIYPSTDGLFLIQEKADGLFGYVDAAGQYVIPPRYLKAYPFKNGMAVVKSIAGWGIISTSGDVIVDCIWSDLIIPDSIDQEYIWVKPDCQNKYICISKINQAPCFTAKYKKIPSNFDSEFQDVAIVSNGVNKYGLVSKFGVEIIPVSQSSYKDVKALYKNMLMDGKKILGEVDMWRMRLRETESSVRHPLGERISSSSWDF